MGEYSPATVFHDRSARLETTLADMNEALASLRYLPDPDYNGFDELVITVWDNGNSADVPNYALTDAGTFSANVTKASTTFAALNDQLQVQEEVQDVYLRGVGNVVTNRIHITVLPANDKPYVRMNDTLQVGTGSLCMVSLSPCCGLCGFPLPFSPPPPFPPPRCALCCARAACAERVGGRGPPPCGHSH